MIPVSCDAFCTSYLENRQDSFRDRATCFSFDHHEIISEWALCSSQQALQSLGRDPDPDESSDPDPNRFVAQQAQSHGLSLFAPQQGCRLQFSNIFVLTYH